MLKLGTIRTMFSITTHFWDPLHQVDVKNAFFHGHLSKAVYIAEPPDFTDPQYPYHVCHLRKATYGLKHTYIAWFLRFNTFLI